MTATTIDAWNEEMKRQSDELYALIEKTIFDHARRIETDGRQPLLNSVATALVHSQGAMLAGIEDPRIRKQVRRRMEQALPKIIASAKVSSFTRIMVVGEDRLQ